MISNSVPFHTRTTPVTFFQSRVVIIIITRFFLLTSYAKPTEAGAHFFTDWITLKGRYIPEDSLITIVSEPIEVLRIQN